MIHLPFLIPLLAAGFVGAVWREHQRGKALGLPLSLPDPEVGTPQIKTSQSRADNEFDDIGELHHYQKVSWYGLAFAASGAWFYPPATLLSIPLLGYNAYHFTKLIRHTDAAGRKSPMTVFESIALAGSLATGQTTTAAVMFLLVFGSRKLLLQAGNIADIGLSRSIDPRFARMWILRDGAEIEASLREIQEGDVVVIRGGDTVLIEGQVLEGDGIVRQYSLLKKPKSINKHCGDKVFPFTQLESGCLHVRRL
jgi:Cation transport ATPase